VSGAPLADRYELGERLGAGGMSTVVLAFDRRLERHVAVKLLAEHLADDREFVSRFRREALAAARLVHPNIVQVFDFGLDEASGRQFIVMEHVHGRSGAEILRERGMLPAAEAVDLISQACRGLDHAHRMGVVHRDVKPGNLLRSDEGVVKLADFGIAKAVSEESSITQIGSVLGTAAYLAPEQATGQGATAQSDIYSLGVVAYQLLAGRLPYEAQTLTELALKQQREAPPLLDAVNPDVNAHLAAVIDRALALEPSDRYDSAEHLRAALEDRDGATAPTSATRVVPAASAATTTSRAGESPGPHTPVQRRQPAAPIQPRQPISPAQPRNQASIAPAPPARPTACRADALAGAGAAAASRRSCCCSPWAAQAPCGRRRPTTACARARSSTTTSTAPSASCRSSSARTRADAVAATRDAICPASARRGDRQRCDDEHARVDERPARADQGSSEDHALPERRARRTSRAQRHGAAPARSSAATSARVPSITASRRRLIIRAT